MRKKFKAGDVVTFKCAGSAVEEKGTVLSYMKNGDVCVLNNGMRIGLKESDVSLLNKTNSKSEINTDENTNDNSKDDDSEENKDDEKVE